jgi:hypothetical protein
MKTNIKKSLKFIALLVTSLLIASASATYYYSLNISGTLTTFTAVIFSPGSDWPSGSTMGAGNTSVSLALKAYPNTTLTYTQALKVKNMGSNAAQIRLRNVNIDNGTSDVGNFTFLKILLIDSSSEMRGYLNYTVSGNNFLLSSSTDYVSISAGDTWSIRIETKAKATAGTDISVSLQVALDVQAES